MQVVVRASESQLQEGENVNKITQRVKGLTLVLLDTDIYGFKHILSQIICH